MKIIFWGTPKYAADNLIHLVNEGQEVIAVVTQPDRKRNRGKNLSPSPVKQAALDFGIPVYETKSIRKDKNTKNQLTKLNADIYIVVAFGQILPKEILEQPKLGCWNSHASLLPAWRGAAPIQWSILNEDRKTGVCIMAMEEGLDTGPVIEQETTEINETDNLEILTNRLSRISAKLLIKALKGIKMTIGLNTNERLLQLKAIEQSKLNGETSYARQINKEDYLIDWTLSAKKIIKRIKGLYPNTYTFYNGKRVKVIEATLARDNSMINENQLIDNNNIGKRKPGEIILIDQRNGIVIMTNDHPILIEYGQLEGKKRTDGYTLSLQSNIFINDIIGN